MAEGSKSSPEAVTQAWVLRAMPSAADLFFVAVLGVLIFTPLSVRLLGDAGIGWHIRTGQQILATHAIPRVDPFSSTLAGQLSSAKQFSPRSKEWFAWEWLYDIVVGQLDARMGLNGVVWFTAVVIAAVFAWCFRLLMRRRTNILFAIVLVLLAMSASTIHFLARPHVLSWLFTLAWFAILDASERESLSGLGGAWSPSPRRFLWALPSLMLVWVNVHGGFLVGFVLLAIFWLSALWTWLTASPSRIEDSLVKLAARQEALNLTLVGFLSAAASLLNPYGWKLYAHVYAYLSNRFLMDHIDEFRSPDFHGVAQKCFLILVLIALAVFAARGRELRLSGLFTVLFAIYAGLYASRNLPVSSLLLVMVVGPLSAIPFAHRFSEKRFSQKMTAVECSLRGHLWPIAAIVVTLAIVANGGRISSKPLIDAHFDPKRMPVAAVDYLEQQGERGPVLGPDSWGGYLIYRMYPQAQVVVDDRHDLYGAEFFKSYLKMVRVEPGWQDFLRDHPASCVIMPRDAALTSILLASPPWKEVYADDVAVVFEEGITKR